MADDPLRDCRTVSFAAERQFDKFRAEFETAWKANQCPRIEDWLERVPDDQKPILFNILAQSEKELRGDPSIAAEFRERFPTFGEWIDTIFRDGTAFDIDLNAPNSAPLPNIPGYRVLERIAFGGMGVVFKAVQIGLDRTVALKMVRGGSVLKDDELTRFRIEARAVAGIMHANIVHIHDFGTFEGLPYFSMEYVDGGSLSHKLVDEPLPFREAAALLEKLSRTIQVVHDRHIVHRDLKPGNILLTRDGIPKISDFGLAKRLGSDISVTVSGTVMGTASYMAPEQARGDKNITESVDVYALGALLYECLTGRPPFKEESYEQTIRKVTDEEPLRPREIVPLVPPELEAICLKSLEKDPARRYAKASDMADDLQRYLNAEPLSIGTFDLIDQHERWARKIGIENIDLMGCLPWSFVYRGREQYINRQVKLKICTGSTGSAAHAHLRRQAEAMAGLNHPNIEQLYSYGEVGGIPYLLQEYTHGRSFSTVMRERVLDMDAPLVGPQRSDKSGEVSLSRLPPKGLFVPIPVRQAVEWVSILARAVHSIHELGIIHGAIYPGEIRLTDAGAPKLCGFAAAQKVAPGACPEESIPSWVRPNYLAPEQVENDWQQLGPATDIYALGTVLYELLTGQVPFFGMNLQYTRDAVRKELTIAPRNLNPRIPSYLDWLCQRCLAKKPADRFASCDEMADALDRYLDTQETGDGETAAIDPNFAESLAQCEFELRLFLAGQSKPAIIALPRRWIAIGRAPESDIIIPDDYCSRHHCAIYWDDGSNQHVLVLIKAKHGVKVNGETIRGSQALIAGDIIQIASARMVFLRKHPMQPT